jgi:hypothetical protein
LKKTGIIISLVLLVLIGTSALLLNTPWLQQKLADRVIRDFHQRTGATLTIDESNFSLFRGLEFHVVHLKDKFGKPVLSAERIDVGIQALPLLQKEVRFRFFRLIRANLYLSRKTLDGPLNIQTILNAYQKKTPSNKPWNLTFSTILLRDCRIHYDITTLPVKKGELDMNHLDLNHFSTKMSFKISSGKQYRFSLSKLQVHEKCGLHIDKLHLEGSISETSLKLTKCDLTSGNSMLKVQEIEASYKNYKELSHINDSIHFKPVMIHLAVVPSDFQCLNKSLSKFSKAINLDVLLEGKLSELVCKNVNLNVENMMSLNGLFITKGLTDLKNLRVEGNLKKLLLKPSGIDFLVSLFSNEKIDLSLLKKLGTLEYTGKVKNTSRQTTFTGDFKTAVGELKTDVLLVHEGSKLSYEGHLTSLSLRLGDLLPSNTLLGETGFDFRMTGSYQPGVGMNGTINGIASHVVYRGYDFKNLTMNGRFDRNGFEGQAALGDANGNLNFSGLVNLTKDMPVYKFDLYAEGFNPFAFGLFGFQSDDSFSFHLHSDLMGHNLDDLTGNLSLDSLRMYSNRQNFFLQQMDLDITRTVGNQRIVLSSPILNAELWGKFQLSGLADGFKGVLKTFLPSLMPSDFKVPHGSNYELHATLTPCSELFSVLHLPYNLVEKSTISGFYDETTGKFHFEGDLPFMTYGKTMIQHAGFLLENPQKEAKLLAFAQFGSDQTPMKMNLDARGQNDFASFKFNISNIGIQTYSGNILGDVRFSRNTDGSLMLDGLLKKSSLIVNDSVWQIHPTALRWQDKSLTIADFQLTHADQYVKFQGIASARITDTLCISLNNFSLDAVFDLLPKTQSNVVLGGNLSGEAKCTQLLGNLTLNADLGIERFTLNKVLMGDLKAKSKWDSNRMALVLDAVVRTDTTNGKIGRQLAVCDGLFYPAKDSLYLSMVGDRLPISFLEPYLGTIFQKMEGVASGNIVISGRSKGLKLNTKAYVENGSFGIEMLNTRYSFSDTIWVSPKLVYFRNTLVRDKDGNTAIANGIIHHDNFKNPMTSVEITGNNILIMDVPAKPNVYFYGKAYGTGSVSINGPQDDIVIDVNLKSEDNTDVTISFLDDTEVTEANFIQFVKHKKVNENSDDEEVIFKKKPVVIPVSTSSNLTVNLTFDITPSANLTLITDQNTGDDIKAKGSGTLRCVIPQVDPIELYGRYDILSGNYKFIYQNILRRDFKIENGGSITFAGDPFSAQVDITADYTVNAQLADLLSSDVLNSLNLNRSSIPVNCVLKLNGELQRPGIRLDLAYPSADDDLKRNIGNVINTEDMLNQQLVFLMLFGRFSTPTYSTVQGSTTSSLSTALNTGISTLSSQLNKVVNGVLGDTKMNFNFNYKNSTYDATTPGEWGVMMSGSFFNNRLSINSNVGSRQNMVQGGGNQFIGEFDANVKFKKSEKWSWKFFNRANDNRYFKSALNTQGAGILYKEDFNSMKDIFKKKPSSEKKPSEENKVADGKK